MLNKIKSFLKEVLTEAKKVDWPSRRDTFKYTAIVLLISAAIAVFLGALDFIFVKLLSIFII